MLIVTVKEEYIEILNNSLNYFSYIPFLFEKDKKYEVDEINNSLIIQSYKKEREFCIKGLDIVVTHAILVFYNFPIMKRRRIFFKEQYFNILTDN